MKSISRYIAGLFLVLFTVTMLPYNFLHHHAEDEHAVAMLHHEQHPLHHCELDDMACEADLNADCGHATHVSKTHPKCFSCDFHFVKLFDAEAENYHCGSTSTLISFQPPHVVALHGAFLFVGNKGPPQAL